ncbi:hypothetical protein HOU78_gp02 [Vibrio phage 1.204.O._10N.222.46.F12]|uniref:SAP domain-containing protein n=1 Tax=Vibrio phage 1.204.O._10N.222.46.F12 TaxID=1881263 RepID=A0A2I7RNJ5_9CAUD|nr:hypothetical protein HOU78_gp02 [Vibrio phage 1.204.O._10N.222.46.F12]AUR95222.1 hypothetical protein NVP1204O_02 [Vibrio phage 1.204.O._10N.222.46.F12]
MNTFKRTIQKITQFPTTRRAQSAKLKTVLLAIGMEAQRSDEAAQEAKKLCEAFLAQFVQEGKQPVKEEVTPSLKFTQEQLEGLHYKKVAEVAKKFGISTEGTKAETIVAILSAQG